MSTTFAYEYYKRNRFALVIGTKGDELKEEFESFKDGDATVFKINGSEPLYNKYNPVITGLYDAKPQTSFSSTFEPAVNELDEIVSTFTNAGHKALTFLEHLKGKDLVGELVKTVGSLFKGDMDNAKKALGDAIGLVQDATNAPQLATVAPALLHWKGSQPITFSVKFIFIDNQGGYVQMNDKIKLLMSTVGSMGFDNGLTSAMKGPIGHNTLVFGEKGANILLNRDAADTKHGMALIKSLHSLILKQGEVTVLDLRNILVITKVDIKTSEQLYIPDGDPKEGPCYKWITADVGFSTVCPIPAPLAKTYTSMLSFYGINQETSP